ncbi:MAG: terpene cyclase/mutase family protein [Planctomycetota bacterium]|nr:terpene cyclase/mutase family protein [Planctomycetota bacterium]
MKTSALLLGCCVTACAWWITGCSKSPPPTVQAPAAPVAPAPPPPAPPPAPKPIQLAPFNAVTLWPGEDSVVELKVERNGNEGPLEVLIGGMPEGVSAKAAKIEAGSSAGPLELAAAPTLGDAELAAKLSVTVGIGELKATQSLLVKVPKLNLPSFAPAAEILLQPGTSLAFDLGFQRNGYEGPAELVVEAAPPQLACQVQFVTPAMNATRLELTAAPDTPIGVHVVRVTTLLYGRKIIGEVPVKVEARPFLVKSFRVVTLRPGETQSVDVPIERGSYQGPLQLKFEGLPEGVTIQVAEVAPGQKQATLQVTAANVTPGVRSSKIVSKAGHLNSSEPIVIRIASNDATYLPPALSSNPDSSTLLRRGSIGGRLSSESKQALLDFYGGTPESEAAVMRGLRWLAAHQQADGSWPLNKYGKDIANCDCQTEFEKAVDEGDTTGTAFGVLPFLGAGVAHNRAPQNPPELAKYQEVVKKALVFLAKSQIRGKDPKDKQDGYLGGSTYAHAAGTIALCEAYGLSGDESLKVNAQLALKYLLQAQHQKGGGWRYGPGEEGDMSVTGWVILAVRSAQLAGLRVLQDPLIRAGRFVDSCAAGPEDAKKSRCGYQPGQPENLPLTAAGLLTRQYLGWAKDEPQLEAGSKYLMENLPPEYGDTLGQIYYYYYATQVLHHLEGENFDLWNHRMREHLIRTQAKAGHTTGSWNPQGTDWGQRGGRLYSTSMALITLQVYYRHLPMYRHVKRTAGLTPTGDLLVQIPEGLLDSTEN